MCRSCFLLLVASVFVKISALPQSQLKNYRPLPGATYLPVVSKQSSLHNYRCNKHLAKSNKDDDAFDILLKGNRTEAEASNIWLESTRRSVQNKLSTAQWVFSYADLEPYTERDIIGIVFLLTNVLYAWSGFVVWNAGATCATSVVSTGMSMCGASGTYWLAVLLEVASIASMYYHWSQLHYGKDNRAVVVKALIIDYLIAFPTVFAYLNALFVASTAAQAVLWSSFAPALIAFGFLALCWKYEYGVPYMVFHGLWHAFSALAAKALYEV